MTGAVHAVGVAVGLSMAAVACSSDSKAPTVVGSASSSTSIPTVKVAATDTTCVVSRTEVPAGDVTLEVDNQGSVVTEVYLYAPRDTVVGEVENVDPGEKKAFNVKVGGGSYEVACKPNQEGDGTRTPFTVTGAPDPALTAPVDSATARGRTSFNFVVTLTDDAFAKGLSELVPVAGQTIVFQVTNSSSAQPHAFAVAGSDGVTSGDTNAIAPGQSAELRITFPTAGRYTAFDSIGDNRSKGLHATFEVIT